ncbi:MAG: membrane protein insertase YidC [Alphaproteobacteria bacterium]|nr:membrane protein insertase YidC [Alphaproteobacteria bacterium]
MEQKNLIIAIVASLAILLGFQFFYEIPRQQAAQEAQRARQAELAAQQALQNPATLPAAPGQSAGLNALTPTLPGATPSGLVPAQALTRADALARSERLAIDTPKLFGTLPLTGARIDDLHLQRYRETVNPTSENIVLLNPSGRPDAYFGETGWIGQAGLKLPSADTVWTANRRTLVPGQPVTLTWDNGEGLRFTRVVEIDQDYMITVVQKVENTSAATVTLAPYARVARSGTPVTQGFFILHEGLIGVLDGVLQEHTYKDMQGDRRIEGRTTGGWLGITDKYWLVALIPDQRETVATRFIHDIAGGGDLYQVDYRGTERTIAPGTVAETQHRFFAGAKEVATLTRYKNEVGITSFDFAVDWGWFHFLTRPIFYLLEIIQGLVGNFGVAILLLTVLIKGLFFPLANKSYVMMSKMRALTPKMTELREKYAEDKQRLQQEMMQLYKSEKVNPLSGCLPILLQIPVFFALYKVLFVTIEMRHAPFFGWIRDLSAPDPTSIFNLFGLLPYEVPGFLLSVGLGIWPLIMGVTMWVQQRLNPPPPDPIQARIFAWMPVIFTFMLAGFPAGLVIYWAWNNLLSIAQQKVIMHRMGVS